MPDGAAPSTKDRSDWKFTVGTDKYILSLNTANYSNDIATQLGLSTVELPADASAIKMTVSKAAREGLIFGLKVRGTKTGKPVTKIYSATIYVPRSHIQTAFTGLPGKTFGTLTIKEVSPILRKLITL